MRALIVLFYIFLIQLAAADDSVVYANIVDPELSMLGLSPERLMDYKTQHEKIISYLEKKNKSEWEGKYSEGMLTGSTLFLTEKNGFSYKSWGCFGTYGIAYGTTEFLSNKVNLLNKTGEVFPKEIFFIKWGTRHYLIPKENMIDFANAVNSGMEPCERGACSFWLKDKDSEKKIRGLPPIPEEYQGYLLKNPIKTKIIEIKDSQTNYKDPKFPVRKTIVVLDVGEQQGVKIGMSFGSIAPSNIFETVKVSEVSSTFSIGEIVEYSPDVEKKPSVDWIFSTKY